MLTAGGRDRTYPAARSRFFRAGPTRKNPDRAGRGTYPLPEGAGSIGSCFQIAVQPIRGPRRGSLSIMKQTTGRGRPAGASARPGRPSGSCAFKKLVRQVIGRRARVSVTRFDLVAGAGTAAEGKKEKGRRKWLPEAWCRGGARSRAARANTLISRRGQRARAILQGSARHVSTARTSRRSGLSGGCGIALITTVSTPDAEGEITTDHIIEAAVVKGDCRCPLGEKKGGGRR